MTNNQTIDILAGRWRQELEMTNKAERTIEEYMMKLNHFINFLKGVEITSVYDITKEHLSAYRKEVFYRLNGKGRQNSSKTQNNYIRSVKLFFGYLTGEGYLKYNPARSIEYAREPELLPKTILTPREIKKLIKTPDKNTPLGYRDRTILEVLYSTGIRRNELLNLKPEDIDYEKGYLRITKGKGGKGRVVPLGKIASRYLENYIKLVRIDLARKSDSPYLFLSSYNGMRMSEEALSKSIHHYAKKARLRKKVTPHVFRHSMATHLLNKKANIRCVQEILGHKRLDTTQKYTHITITDLKEAHKAHHPREKDENY